MVSDMYGTFLKYVVSFFPVDLKKFSRNNVNKNRIKTCTCSSYWVVYINMVCICNNGMLKTYFIYSFVMYLYPYLIFVALHVTRYEIAYIACCISLAKSLLIVLFWSIRTSLTHKLTKNMRSNENMDPI